MLKKVLMQAPVRPLSNNNYFGKISRRPWDNFALNLSAWMNSMNNPLQLFGDNCWLLVDFIKTNAMDDQLWILFQDFFRDLDIEIDDALSKIEKDNKHT